MPGRLFRLVSRAAAAGLLATATALPVHAQEGPATTGAQVLQLPAGSRAAALSGAYVAAASDADVLFYNPAGAAALEAAASLAYSRYVQDVILGSLAGVFRVGPATLGVGLLYLDAGTVDVIEPDPDFGGERGRETGATASAAETAARLALALPLAAGRLRLGAAAGYISNDLAGLSRSAPLFDLGVQFAALPRLTLGVAVRNLGGSLTGDGAQDARLPTEARLGAALELPTIQGFGVQTFADLVSQLREGITSFAAGIEAGLLPRNNAAFGALGRLGYDSATGEDGLGGFRFGAGLFFAGVAVDYTYRNLKYFGPTHHIGIRWTRFAQ